LQRQGLDISVKAFFPFHLHRANLMTVEELEATTANQPMTAEQAAIILLQRMSPLLAQSGHGAIEFQCPLLGVKRT
jgi:hypothetical protein